MCFDDNILFDDIFYWQFWIIKDFYRDDEYEACWNLLNGFSKVNWNKGLIVDQPIHRTVQLDTDESHEVIELTAKFHSDASFIIDDLFELCGPRKETSDGEDIMELLYKLFICHSHGFCCASHTLAKFEQSTSTWFESQYRFVNISGMLTEENTPRQWGCKNINSFPNKDESNRWVKIPDGNEFLFDKAPDEEFFKETLLKKNLAKEIITWQLSNTY